MASHTAIGVDDDLAPGEASVGVRAPELEDPGRVGEEADLADIEVAGQQRGDDLIDQIVVQRPLEVDAGGMLGRDEHRVNRHRLAVLVDHAHLSLAVGAEVAQLSVAPNLSQPLREPVAQPNRQGHQVGGLVAGEPEHHPLVAGTLTIEHIFTAGPLAQLESLVDTLGDVGALTVERHQDGAGAAVESLGIIVVANLVHRVTHQRRHVHRGLGGDLAGNKHHPGGQQCLTGNPALRVLLEHGVEYGVGHLVGHLVRVTFGD